MAGTEGRDRTWSPQGLGVGKVSTHPEQLKGSESQRTPATDRMGGQRLSGSVFSSSVELELSGTLITEGILN